MIAFYANITNSRIANNNQILLLLKDDESDERDRRTERLEKVETMWGVFDGVTKEWGGHFETLVKYHNIPLHFGALDRSELRKKDELDVKTLENLMVPFLNLGPERYKQEEPHYDATRKGLFQRKTEPIEMHEVNPRISPNHKGIVKNKFLKGIIKEVRCGNKEVG